MVVINPEFDFEEHLKSMSDRDLAEFTARRIKDVCETQKDHESRIRTLENQNIKALVGSGGIGGLIVVIFELIRNALPWFK